MHEISIIIPYYNSQNTIRRALESVVSQTYKDYEIILINDGSTDKSNNIVDDFISNNKNIAIKNFNQSNQGVSNARNKGIKESSGEYIAFLDSDDEWVPEKLEKQIELMKKYNIDMIGCNVNIIKNGISKKHYITNKKIEDIAFRKALFKHYFLTPTVVIKKSVLINEGMFPENQRLAEDTHIYMKIVRKYKSVVIEDFLVNIHKDMYGESGLTNKMAEGQKWELINFYTLRKDNNKYKNNNYLGILLFIVVCGFSIMKFFRRETIATFKRLKRVMYNKGIEA